MPSKAASAVSMPNLKRVSRRMVPAESEVICDAIHRNYEVRRLVQRNIE